MDFIEILTQEFELRPAQVKSTVELIDAGNTIPFIARYRKEATGELDDQILRSIFERLEYLRGLAKRKAEVLSSIEEQGKLTPELQAAVDAAKTLAVVEDIYRPYRQKRKTRASVAKERGLEPLALLVFEQKTSIDPALEAESYITDDVPTVQDAINGACDIIAEQISDNADTRGLLRSLFNQSGKIVSSNAKKEDSVYSGYYEFDQLVKTIVGHRILAIDRGEREGFLKVKVEVDEPAANELILKKFVRGVNPSAELVKRAALDSFARLIQPSLEREVRSNLTEMAATGAISVFSGNLKQLLLVPPIKGKVVLGLDPAYRTGCKVAVVDATGKVLATDVIYPTMPHNKVDEAKRKLKSLISKHGIEIIAIGNGTASKETEIFAAELIKELKTPLSYMMVSEAGASVYSASKLASLEFPEYDVSLRSAVSIARRLQDPLAELVKIEPKAVGVGQYQHDMPKAQLDTALDGVVEFCVNTVGVDLNTASAPLLSRVSGINSSIAKNIVEKREENGEFKGRKELLKVAKLGPKAFVQAAGFLRIPFAKNKLDTTAVHPESYEAAEGLLKICGFSIKDIGTDNISPLSDKIKELGLSNIAKQLNIGEPTLKDIVSELQKPGRDMRDELPPPMLRTDIMDINDLKAGSVLMGTVRNVIDFGAFVDIGVHQDGLVHISQICNKYIKHPNEVLSVGDIVKVAVLEIDKVKKRISLTMKNIPNTENVAE